jgi:acid phosphatase family membrane protein YuiD
MYIRLNWKTCSSEPVPLVLFSLGAASSLHEAQVALQAGVALRDDINSTETSTIQAAMFIIIIFFISVVCTLLSL